jgi:hypothetical protein
MRTNDVSDSPLEVGLWIGLDEGVNGSDAALGALAIAIGGCNM